MTMVAEGTRRVLYCNHCKARMDIGLAANPRVRLPTGWNALEDGKHLCTMCVMAGNRAA